MQHQQHAFVHPELGPTSIVEYLFEISRGGYGHLIQRSMPTVGKCCCLDLTEFIDDALSTMKDDGERDQIAILVPGNMFEQLRSFCQPLVKK